MIGRLRNVERVREGKEKDVRPKSRQIPHRRNIRKDGQGGGGAAGMKQKHMNDFRWEAEHNYVTDFRWEEE